MKKLFSTFIGIVVALHAFGVNAYISVDDIIGNDDTYIYIKDPNMSDSVSKDFSFEVFERVELLKLDLPSCVENPPDLEKCVPYICKVESKLGDIYIRVKGMNEDSCEYIERNIGIEGINCAFKKGGLSKYQTLFIRRFKKLSGEKSGLTPEDYSDLNTLFRTECTFVPDYNSSKPISLAKINSDEIDPEFNTSDLSKYSIINKTSNNNKYNDKDKDYIANLSNYRSIMLIPKETELIR
jgi:hypothetical protein